MADDTVTVEIGGRSYTLKSGGNPDYVRQVAQFVDDRMKEISQMAPSLQPVHLSVLTAMNIADELFQRSGEDLDKLRQVQSRIQTIIERIPS